MAIFDGDHRYEFNIAVALGTYLFAHCLIISSSKRFEYPLSIRPAMICGSVHAIGTATIALFILVSGGHHLYLWQRMVLPFSVSYYAADIMWSCIPNNDLTMTLHHLVMIGCHYPLGEANGALVAGAGDPDWCLRLSMIGYLGEWTTVFLNARLLLTGTACQRSATFSVVSLLLLSTYAYRLFLFPYILLFEIFPRYPTYSRRQQILTFYIMVLGHLLVLHLSIQWIAVILKFGIRRFVRGRSQIHLGRLKEGSESRLHVLV